MEFPFVGFFSGNAVSDGTNKRAARGGSFQDIFKIYFLVIEGAAGVIHVLDVDKNADALMRSDRRRKHI